MKLFLIELDTWGYDEWDSCVIAEESIEAVNKRCTENNFFELKGLDYGHTFYITENQKCDSIKYLGEADSSITEPCIICSSFNAG